jgi:hypothetical protein
VSRLFCTSIVVRPHFPRALWFNALRTVSVFCHQGRAQKWPKTWKIVETYWPDHSLALDEHLFVRFNHFRGEICSFWIFLKTSQSLADSTKKEWVSNALIKDSIATIGFWNASISDFWNYISSLVLDKKASFFGRPFWFQDQSLGVVFIKDGNVIICSCQRLRLVFIRLTKGTGSAEMTE